MTYRASVQLPDNDITNRALHISAHGAKTHSRRDPATVSSGIKWSQRVSTRRETLGATRICAPQMVLKCPEHLGATHVRELQKVSESLETLGATHIRRRRFRGTCRVPAVSGAEVH